MTRGTSGGLFHSAEEYQEALLSCVRRLLGIYGQEYLSVSESGILHRAGGTVMSRKELEELLTGRPLSRKTEEQMGEIYQELLCVRRAGRDTIRSGVVIPMEYVFHAFGLDDLEAYMVMLSWAAETDHDLGILISLLNEKNGTRLPTMDLCIRTCTFSQEEQLLRRGQCIRRWRILSFLFCGLYDLGRRKDALTGEGYLERELKLDHRILCCLEDPASADPRLETLVQYGYPEEGVLLIHGPLLLGLLERSRTAGEPEAVFVSGEPGAGKRYLLSALCREKKKTLLLADAGKLPAEPAEAFRTLFEIIREALLKGGAAICFCHIPPEEGPEEVVSGECMELLLRGTRLWKGELYFASDYEWNAKIRSPERKVLKLQIPETSTEERLLLWDAFLKEEERPKGLDLEYLADKYALSAGAVKSSAEDYRAQVRPAEGLPEKRRLLEACRRQLSHQLGRDAVCITARYHWDDLVLPAAQKQMLKDACDQVRCHHQVYHRWGFEEKIAYGKGVSMIFYGPPGTGKTMGAQVLANELDLELYKVDMAGVMSKYVGESEKKLGNIFEQARKSQSILFFDEADVLFGQRTDQKDSNDKYANASTAYLLQKIEEYEGIMVLATNLLQNFDNAFLRRFKFIIEFPAADEARRREIWQNVFPGKAPKEELDFAFLAQEYPFSGSQIKNAAVAAAFLAAGEKRPVGMRHVLTAVKREMAKTGKTLIADDFGPYYDLMQEG